jgi:hypothetical protein
MALGAITAALGIGEKLIERIFPDPTERAKAQQALASMQQTGELERLATQAGIITAEANGESWLQRNWRPVTMLWFAGLVGAHWLGYTPPNLGEAQVLALLDIVQVGIGGYVVGRSVEKGIREWKRQP